MFRIEGFFKVDKYESAKDVRPRHSYYKIKFSNAVDNGPVENKEITFFSLFTPNMKSGKHIIEVKSLDGKDIYIINCDIKYSFDTFMVDFVLEGFDEIIAK